MKTILIVITLIFSAFFVRGQSAEELLAQLLAEEKNTVDALVLYPQPVRSAILEASLHPEALVKLETMQANTSKAFKALLEGYPKETQEMLWDLTRYPGLIPKLASGPELSQQLDKILADYPEEIHQIAREAQEDYYDLLYRMHQLNDQSEVAFNNLIREYPGKTQDALRQLVDLPEVLTLLIGNIRLTLMVGDLYKRNPVWLNQQLDSLNLVAAREHAQELEDWKTGLEANPEAREELARTAQDFAEEYAYDDTYYDYDEAEPTVVEHHYYYHYPYWFGYPHWYVYPRWRRYPFWYEWGFYSGPGNTIVIIDLPSFYFVNWYFYHPHHHFRYPGLSAHFTNHYYYHPRSGGSITIGVHNWRTRNRDVISDVWIDKARRDREQFREYGRFETAREDYNRTHPDKTLEPRVFLEKNTRKYPGLTKDQPAQPERKTGPVPPIQRPRTEPPSDRKPADNSQKPELRRPRTEKPPVVKEIPPRTVPKEIPKVDKARDLHREKWEKPQPEKGKTEAKPAPSRTRSDKPAPTVKKETPRKKEGGGGR